MFTDKERQELLDLIAEKYPINWEEGQPSNEVLEYQRLLDSIRTKLQEAGPANK